MENGFTGRDNQITRLTAEHYLKEIRESGADTLILGCTHYPIIADIIADVLPNVTLISTGREAALAALKSVGAKTENGSCKYYVSDDPEMFASSAEIFLGEPVKDSVEKININKF